MFWKSLLAAATLFSPLLALPRPAPIALPLTFEPNGGQTDKRVKFLAHGQKSTLWLTERGPVLAVSAGSKTALFGMRFEGGARAPEMVAENPQSGVSNYLTGSDPSKWTTHVEHFAKVRYRDVYPGIDVVFYGNPQQIEYDFVIAPGADPARIRVAFDGVDRLRVDPNGDLVMETRQGEIRNRKPSIYQGDKPIDGHYIVRGKRKAGFALEAYEKTKPLIIDPVLTYATLLGGSGGDQPSAIAMDAKGMLYVVGETTSINFPLKNALFTSGLNRSEFNTPFPSPWVAEIDPLASGGASLVYSTYIGGQYGGQGLGIAVDSTGNAVVTGITDSSPDLGFPLKNAFQSTFQNSNDCGIVGIPMAVCPVPFVMKITPGGASLVYSSYYGGGNGDESLAVTLDATGNAYMVGFSQSTGIALQSWNGVPPFQTGLRQTRNGFLNIVGPTGSLLYATYFGGGQDTVFTGVAVDSTGLIYVVGNTSYTGLPVTPGSYQPKAVGANNAFVVVFNLNPSANNVVQYCTYLGAPQDPFGGAAVFGQAIAADGASNIYIGGYTDSVLFPTTANAAFPTTSGPTVFNSFQDAFIAKLNIAAQGSAQLVYSTFFGDGGYSTANAIAVDSLGRITVAGSTNTFLLTTTPDAFQCCFDGGLLSSGVFSYFGFVARFDPSKSGASSLLYSTYLGGNTNSLLTSLAQDSAGKTLAVAGWIQNNAPVTPSAYQQNYSGQDNPALQFGQGDAYIARFDMTTEGPQISGIYNAGGLSQLTPPALSPGLIFQIRGTLLGPSTASYPELDSNGLVTTTNAGVQVLVNGVPAPLIYVSSTVINAIAPYELVPQIGANARVQVVYNGLAGALVPVVVTATAPGILNYDDGSGQAVVGNQDYSANNAGNPAAIGSVITIYATGEGQTTPPGVDGLPADNFNALPKPTAPVTVTIGGVPANVAYAGAAPTAVAGLFQLNVTIPSGVVPGPSVPILVTVGGVKSQTTATIAVKSP